MNINIKGINKAQLLAALHNGTRPLGLGVLSARASDMTRHEAEDIIADHAVEGADTVWFDYIAGRPIKVGFRGDELLRADLYDRDAPSGDGSALRIVAELRAKAVTP